MDPHDLDDGQGLNIQGQTSIRFGMHEILNPVTMSIIIDVHSVS